MKNFLYFIILFALAILFIWQCYCLTEEINVKKSINEMQSSANINRAFGGIQGMDLSAFKKPTTIMYNIGGIFYKKNRFNDAIEYFAKASISSSNPRIYSMLGLCYYKLKDYNNAIKNLTRVCDITPGDFNSRLLLMKVYLKN